MISIAFCIVGARASWLEAYLGSVTGAFHDHNLGLGAFIRRPYDPESFWGHGVAPRACQY